MKAPCSVAALAVSATISPVHAAVSEEQFEQLRAEMLALSQRVQVLETENAELRELAGESTEAPAAPASVSPGPDHWTERLSIKGDFRYRYEEIDVEGLDTRDRNRIRARVELQARLPHGITVGTGLSTGGDSPVSANQTLGGGGGRKDVSLALAYARWQALESLAITGGKVKNPYFRPQGTGLLWDSDFHPEGLALEWEEGALFMAGSVNYLESDSRRGNQQVVWGLQGGLDLDFEGMTLITGAGYYDIPTAGKAAFFGGPNEFFGNSFTCDDPLDPEACRYRYDYEELEVFAELSLHQLPLPVSLYAHWVENQAVDDNNLGWILGFNVGEARDSGSWQLGYQYQELEADAVLGLVSDSNFAGGGTDGEGHRLYGTYAIDRQIQLGFTWFLNNEAGGNLLEEPLAYDRVIFDARFKY